MRENDQMFQDFEKVNDFQKEVINPVLPNAKFASSLMITTPGEAAKNFKGDLSPIKLFENSPYEYKGNNKFTHFTSLFGLKAILESGFLRMSEFGNLIDNNELLFATSVFEDNNILFKITEDKIKALKENVFCLSLCESKDKTHKNNFMWEVYGDKGKGVIIEIEFTKNNPDFFLLGSVLYGNKKLKPIREIKRLTEEFASKNDNFIPNNFPEFLLELQAFHKSKKYNHENEVRLLMKENKQQYDEHKLETIYKDFNSNQEVKYFNKLFLKGKHPYLKDYESQNSIKILDEFPQIEIRRVILGYNISVENKVNITDLLQKIKHDNDYDFEIWQINNDKEIFAMR
ncbi:hypothetical protein GCM10008015_22540 [Flavobacterium palustre]|uniref:DUF2971 domain-containing protein n=1 Tax=Flavobacterium palustre TaxID=1476463 RepID=A0ABQ1HLL6_9FLAO|nr:DUF2971 domain-containing protein [Flavobacterium palustre]GGA81262.1 hypothetical protein GCM10008015_22540 [Flavobacterium palustre]